ncbi:MAG: DUF3772 domain-containing protein, partial [Paracoccaceae bacterium]|nr:DUF3772 domain-containing protein [Paracoccaceae bacterium]
MKRLFRVIFLILALALPGAGGLHVGAVFAQETSPVSATPDYARWQAISSRAESAIEAGRASNLALEQLRVELVNWRSNFLDAQNQNKSRVETIRSQLASLGPAPEAGQTEPAEIAARRAELNGQLARLDAPRRTAEEAYSHADGLIREVDTIIRERQAERLLELGPSPVNPIHWPTALRSVSTLAKVMLAEVQGAWASETQRKLMQENLPASITYLLVAFFFIARGRSWMDKLARRVERFSKRSRAQRDIFSFLISTGQIILPVAGIYALVQAVNSLGLLGLRTQLVLDSLPEIGLAIFGSRWLASRLLPIRDVMEPAIPLPEHSRNELRRHAAILGLLWGLNVLAVRLAEFESWPDSVRNVALFPFIVLGGLFLLRSGQLLGGVRNAEPDRRVLDFSLRQRLIEGLSRLMMAIGFGGPVLAAIGYFSAASNFVFPAIQTLALLGMVTMLSGVLHDVYSVLTRTDDADSDDALVPVLVTFMLTVAALPVLGLIWGLRVSDLMELWARFREGFAVGDTRISPTDFLTFVAVFFLGMLLTRLLQAALRGSILPRTKIDQGGRNAIVSGTGYVGIFLAAVVGITTAGIDLSSLAIVAGALSVGIGFGLQNIVSNFVSGIILLIERPISEGDWIEVGGQMGYVRDISVRSTRIETFDKSDVIVPNADLISGTVTNYTRGDLIGRAIIPVGVAYGTDTKEVETILREIANAHPL